jgi:transcription factor TFIIIB component B''
VNGPTVQVADGPPRIETTRRPLRTRKAAATVEDTSGAIPSIVPSIETAEATPAGNEGPQVIVLNAPRQKKKKPRTKTPKDNWVVTTPADIRAAKSRKRAKTPVEDQVEGSEAGGPAESRAKPALAAVSRRVANREKRKQKSSALQRVLARIVGSVAGDSATDGENADNGDSPRQVRFSEEWLSAGDDPEHPAIVKKPRKRAGTPDEAENVMIVPSIVTMNDLASRDRRTGRKSDRERKMRQIDWTAVKERRKGEEHDFALRKGRLRGASEDGQDDEEDADENGELDVDAELARVMARNRSKRQGIQVRVVNGEHVIDEQSQKVDRHAIANEDMGALEEIEEDDLTKRFNSQTYVNMKRRDPAERVPSKDRWGEADTEKFYGCLSRFGTDFMVISKMFKDKSRRHIRAKFVREERLNPDRVQAALVGPDRGKWDLDLFLEEARRNGKDFNLVDPREVEEQLRVRKEEREREIEEKRQETAELKKQRNLAGDYSEEDEAAGEDDWNSKMSKKKKRKGKTGKEVERSIEQDGSIEIIDLAEGEE